MPRRFVVVSAEGLADCVGIGGPLPCFGNALYSTIRLSNTSRLGGHVRTYSSRSWAVGAVPGAESSSFSILLLAYRESSVTEGGRFGTTVRTRAQGLDDESKADDSAVNPLPALHAALPLVPSLYHLRYTSASRLPTQPTPHM